VLPLPHVGVPGQALRWKALGQDRRLDEGEPVQGGRRGEEGRRGISGDTRQRTRTRVITEPRHPHLTLGPRAPSMGGGQTINHSRQLGGSRSLREFSGELEKAAIQPKKAASSP